MVYMREITWDKIDGLDDSEITYLLYLEGKDMKTIGLIRKMEKGEVERQIIEAKIRYRAYEGNRSTEDIIKKLMKYRREERGTILEDMDSMEKYKIEQYASERLFDSSRDECNFYIWLLGELKSREAVPSLTTFLKATDGNVRRTCCSALGKIGDIRAEEGLLRVLEDSRPQVREYAVKALGRIGSKRACPILKKMIEDPEERDYVKRSAQWVLDEIFKGDKAKGIVTSDKF